MIYKLYAPPYAGDGVYAVETINDGSASGPLATYTSLSAALTVIGAAQTTLPRPTAESSNYTVATMRAYLQGRLGTINRSLQDEVYGRDLRLERAAQAETMREVIAMCEEIEARDKAQT